MNTELNKTYTFFLMEKKFISQLKKIFKILECDYKIQFYISYFIKWLRAFVLKKLKSIEKIVNIKT